LSKLTGFQSIFSVMTQADLNLDVTHESGSYQLDSISSMFTAWMQLLVGTQYPTNENDLAGSYVVEIAA